MSDYPFLSEFLEDYNNDIMGTEVNFTAYKPYFEGVNTTRMYLQLAHRMDEMLS